MRRERKRTDVPAVIDTPERARLGVTVGGHARVVEADDGDAGRQVGLIAHTADVNHDGRGLRRRQRQRRAEPARLAAGRHLDADCVAAARRLDRLLAVVRVVAVSGRAVKIYCVRP